MSVERLADRGSGPLARPDGPGTRAPVPHARDLRRQGTTAYLHGRDDDGEDLVGRAYRAFLAAGHPMDAGRAAFWVGLALSRRGRHAAAGGWFARVRRLATGRGGDVLTGYLELVAAYGALDAGDAPRALRHFCAALAAGRRAPEPDVVALAALGRAQVTIAAGDVAAGVGMLDELMLTVTAGDLGDLATGTVCCAVLGLCHERFDVGRAHEWSTALERWCAGGAGAVRGECLVHRSAVLRRRGDWAAARRVAEVAVERLAGPPPAPALGEALYQLGEMQRSTGDPAERSYLRAHDAGRDPQPGLALLRLAQGRPGAAAAALRRAVREAADPVARCCLLPAAVEVLVAVGDLAAAQDAAALLATEAQGGTAWLAAEAERAEGTVLLARGSPAPAATRLRAAHAAWRSLGAPYEAACAEVLLGRARRAAGDEEAALLDLRSARDSFARLGARPDVARVDRLLAGAGPAGRLTVREAEVLRLVAGGRSNRAVATELVLSEKTVARHVSNIFTKLGVASRSAATAWAYEHHVV